MPDRALRDAPHEYSSSSASTPGPFDRRAAALQFLGGITLGYEKRPGFNKLQAKVGGEDIKDKLRSNGPREGSGGGGAPTQLLTAPHSRRERNGWEEKLQEDQAVGSQFWVSASARLDTDSTSTGSGAAASDATLSSPSGPIRCSPFVVLSVLNTGGAGLRRRDRQNHLLLTTYKKTAGSRSGARRGRRVRMRGGVSYGNLLDLDPPEYDPSFLTGNFKLKKHRVVMRLPGVVGSVISYVHEKDRRAELNRLFRDRHDEWLTTSKMSLSKAVKVRKLILEIVLELDLEISTAALAYAYFERLVLQNVVSKYNRKIAAGVALLLAFKYNEPVTRAAGRARLVDLFDEMEAKLHVRRADVLKSEIGALVYLQFDLDVAKDAIWSLFDGMLATAFDDIIPDAYQGITMMQNRDRRPVAVSGGGELDVVVGGVGGSEGDLVGGDMAGDLAIAGDPSGLFDPSSKDLPLHNRASDEKASPDMKGQLSNIRSI